MHSQAKTAPAKAELRAGVRCSQGIARSKRILMLYLANYSPSS
jgi:hypothetical protein